MNHKKRKKPFFFCSNFSLNIAWYIFAKNYVLILNCSIYSAQNHDSFLDSWWAMIQRNFKNMGKFCCFKTYIFATEIGVKNSYMAHTTQSTKLILFEFLGRVNFKDQSFNAQPLSYQIFETNLVQNGCF